MALIRLNQVSLAFGAQPVFRDADFSLDANVQALLERYRAQDAVAGRRDHFDAFGRHRGIEGPENAVG